MQVQRLLPGGPTPSELRVIFLDVDGVLCCNTDGVLESDKLALLRDVVVATQAKVVLSTNWRYYPDLKSHLIDVLESFGIDCIGDTPNCGPDSQRIRPMEIAAWLRSWQSSDRPKITQYVAIDDRLLLSETGGERLRGHFVLTNVTMGLTERVAAQLVTLLLSTEADSPPGSPLPSLNISPGRAVGSPPCKAVVATRSDASLHPHHNSAGERHEVAPRKKPPSPLASSLGSKPAHTGTRPALIMVGGNGTALNTRWGVTSGPVRRRVAGPPLFERRSSERIGPGPLIGNTVSRADGDALRRLSGRARH